MAPTAVRESLKFRVRFSESAAPNDALREIPVILIKEGRGNPVDNHFYKGELLEKRAAMFDGVKAYADHQTKSQETDQPERSIRQIVGYYHTPHVVVLEGKKCLAATLKILEGPTYQWAWDLAKESAKFAEKYKDKDLIGLSINAYGSSHIEEVAGQDVKVVDDFAEVGSVDMVTAAGAGGGFRLREAMQKILEGGTDMKDLLAKHGTALAQLHGAIKANPEHEKAYGPAMDELMKSHQAMVQAHEAGSAAPAAGAPADNADGDGAEESFKKTEAQYKAGKLSETEKKLFEMVLQGRAEKRVRENVQMVEKVIREAGIPAAYADDLPLVCAGRTEPEVKKLVEARKALVGSLSADRGLGAGAGGNGGDKTKSKLAEKLAAAGVKIKTAA